MTSQSKSKGKPKASQRKNKWADYEDVARHVLQQLAKQLGLAEVEGKQKLPGLDSGTEWEIDAKGVRDGDGTIVVIECRCYKNRLTQEALGGGGLSDRIPSVSQLADQVSCGAGLHTDEGDARDREGRKRGLYVRG